MTKQKEMNADKREKHHTIRREKRMKDDVRK